jgi:hypothetical protein
MDTYQLIHPIRRCSCYIVLYRQSPTQAQGECLIFFLTTRFLTNLYSGVFSFASTTFIVSMYNLNAAGVHTPNIVLGMAIFAGGLLPFIAGMWQFPRGDVYSATGTRLEPLIMDLF